MSIYNDSYTYSTGYNIVRSKSTEDVVPAKSNTRTTVIDKLEQDIFSPSNERKSIGADQENVFPAGEHLTVIAPAPSDIFQQARDLLVGESVQYQVPNVDDTILRLFLKKVPEFEQSTMSTVSWWIGADRSLHCIVAAAEAPRKDNTADAFKTRFESYQPGARWRANRNVASNLVGAIPVQAGQVVADVIFFNWNGQPPRTYGGADDAAIVNHPNLVVEVEWRRLIRHVMTKVNDTYLNLAFIGPNNTTVDEVWVVLIPEGVVPIPALRVLPGAGPLVASQQCAGVAMTQAQLPVPAAPMVLIIMSRNANQLPVIFEIWWNQRFQLPAWSVRGAVMVDTNDLLDTVYI